MIQQPVDPATRSPEARATAALRDMELGCRRLISEVGAADSAKIAGMVSAVRCAGHDVQDGGF